MKTVLGLALVACLIVAVWADFDFDKAWKEFKEKHRKNYKNKEHEAKSHTNFGKNHKFIEEHNSRHAAGLETFTLGHNALSDLGEAEFRRTRCGTIRAPSKPEIDSLNGEPAEFEIFVDVRQTGTVDYSVNSCMTPVKDQGDCGSCYAFSTIAALEFYNCKKSGNKKTFSEQQLVDCSNSFGNNGCDGGTCSGSYDYVIKEALGIAGDAAYPYKAQGGTCTFSTSMKSGSVASYVRSNPEGDENLLMTTFTQAKGPVNVGVDAGQTSFQLYKSGVYTEKQCTTDINHAVLVVGYGTLNGINYWKVKNSWGTTWGLSGYMLIERGANRCGIASDTVAYPKI